MLAAFRFVREAFRLEFIHRVVLCVTDFFGGRRTGNWAILSPHARERNNVDDSIVASAAEKILVALLRNSSSCKSDHIPNNIVND
jgi:hypothetical protein